MSIRHDALPSPLADDGLPGVPGLLQMSSRSPEQRSALAEASRLLVEHLGAVPTTLQSCGASDTDRAHLTAHLGRKALQGCPTRDFRAAWRKDAEGQSVPKLYRVGHPSLTRMQYVALTHRQYAAVVVIDVDRPGAGGGRVEHIAPQAYREIAKLAGVGAGPAWIGVNPSNGKAQLIWLVDPVHADGSGESPNMRLLKATGQTLGAALGGDPAFAHNLSRSPLYTGDDPTAYRWHCQHHRIDRLADLIEEARTMTGKPAPAESTPPKQKFSSGRELLEAVQSRRRDAEAFKAMADELDGDLPSAEAMDTDRIDGVKVLWVTEGRAARDETAFRHALATAHQLRAAGKRMTDAAIIDAYERAYAVAQAVGADSRVEDMPAMRDRLTMARRVRGYVISGKSSHRVSGGPSATGTATSRERKALATMGRKGGKKAAQRWKDDPDGGYARGELKKLEKANRQRSFATDENKGRVLSYIASERREGREPSTKEVAAAVGLSVRRVQQLRKSLGMGARRGRPGKSATP